jgi:pimeloyl-ACP methyl ester carboxylesterase
MRRPPWRLIVITKLSLAAVLLLVATTAPHPATAEGLSSAGRATPTRVARGRTATNVDVSYSADILTIDRFVPHTSTVPANQGQQVGLFVRERVRGGDDLLRPVVLMIGGAATPSVEAFDLPFGNYSWMAFLAEAGFDVFAMDLTGYGLSPRPKMDDPCNAHPDDQKFLIPNPLAASCRSSYPNTLSSMQSDWDEMDTVVNYIRQLRDIERISLLGWSRAGVRIGGYTARHPEKVERLFLYAPRYNRLDPSLPPGLPEPGVPMRVQPVTDFAGWDAEVQCANQFTPAIRDVMTLIRREFDPLGSTWGAVGVRRSPVQGTLFGWNPTVSSQISAPTLIIAGDLDATTGVAQGRNLYSDLPIDNKVFIHVACASHQLVWENQHTILLSASKEWLSHGTFEGYVNGSFAVDAEAHVQKEASVP